MESHGHQEHHQAAGLRSAGVEGEKHEKKSVLEKVKAKANEIKDAITKHEDDDEEEMEEDDTQVHGAPRQDLSDYTTFDPEQVEVSKDNGITFGGGQTHPVGPQTGVGGRPTQPATQF